LIRDITWGADIEAVELDFYFRVEGNWLPVVQAPTFSEALQLLEEKVQLLNLHDDWQNAVYTVFEQIPQVNDGSYGLKISIENDTEGIFIKPEWKQIIRQ